jgi:hypothetical protein
MAQPTAQSPTPHLLSLKVLRLSRPSFATQTPLPTTSFSPSTLNIHPSATLAYPSTTTDKTNWPSTSSSPLTPLLTLPASFGAAYVGETFACTLCVNNDLEGNPSDDGETANPNSGKNPTITAVRLQATLQTPSNPTGVPLELQQQEEEGPQDSETSSSTPTLPPSTTLQKTLSTPLKEPGPHVLAVTVTYTSTNLDGNNVAIGSAARTFRKLYQFVAQPVVAVRSKIGVLGDGVGVGGGGKGKGRGNGGKRWVLEAQLENVGGGGSGGIVVERCFLKAGVGVFWRGGIGGVDGNGDGDGDESEGDEVRGKGSGGGKVESVVLRPRDVQQVMFVVEDREAGGSEWKSSLSGWVCRYGAK